MIWKLTKEFFIAMFWVFAVIIVGYFLMDWLINRNIPLASTFSSWVEQHSQAGG